MNVLMDAQLFPLIYLDDLTCPFSCVHGCERQHGISFWRKEEMGQTWLPASFSLGASDTVKHPKGWTNRQDRGYSVGLLNLHAGCLAFWQFLNRSPGFQTQEQISHGSVPCGRQCVMVLNVQESMGFPTEAPSWDVAVTGVALFSFCANFLLSNEISLAGKLTRSLLPYLNAFTKLLPSNRPQNPRFTGRFVQSCWRPGVKYTEVHKYVCIHSLPCRTASLHKCCFHGNKDKNTE